MENLLTTLATYFRIKISYAVRKANNIVSCTRRTSRPNKMTTFSNFSHSLSNAKYPFWNNLKPKNMMAKDERNLLKATFHLLILLAKSFPN